ncbi:MAG: Asp-tRNA(Asn)/Glu-tRNA(Gln) amidotransferase subunit GatA [Waddliaceae bacterium]|nr:Asp-tRNA(Asn)/Glu-tRNA(Gln) amidotransferase subunit GatA [Waddliaceae bacterium]MBT6928399.1 Asp-tRNA(Asn)/Glu-tRNA(Gln) amidotransferase subunit GatA [Waddliaceae bacterium]
MYRLSASELHRRFCSGEVSAVEIIESFLAHIADIDGDVGAFLKVFDERARAKAAALDAKRASGASLGKLAGVPIAIKDNTHIKDEITSCASKFLENYVAPFDATVVRLLEEEDAIIIGKTNMDEFSMGSSCEYSALKTTHNPWNLRCVPGGSSGGSAAAVAARMCPIALGSDTGGSIRQPAALCGVAGYKPTYGRVSRYGLVAFASSFDQIGPIAHDSRDIAMVMEVLGQHCDKDSTSIPRGADDIVSGLDSADVSGMTIGVPDHLLDEASPEVRENFYASIDVLKGLGAKVVDVDLSILKYSIALYYILATAEASTNLARFDGIRYGLRSSQAKTLDEIYDLSKEEGFGFEVKRRIILGTYVLSSGFQDAYYHKAQKIRTLIIDKFNEAFKTCDIISLPTSPFPAFELDAVKDPMQMYLSDIYTIAANLAGVPAMSVPSGFAKNGLPLGIQFTGPLLEDSRVCHMSYAYQQATSHHECLPSIITEGK